MPLLFYKKVGETPLQALERLRIEKPELSNQKLSYAGRLDPLAHGLLLVLVGDECNESNRSSFLGLTKEYEVEVLFGVSTDTFDLMGIPKFNNLKDPKDLIDKVRSTIPKFIGNNHNLKYPAFSSKTVNGRALFDLAKSGEIDLESLPKTLGSINDIQFLGTREVSLSEVKAEAKSRISKVVGDFRQENIIKSWELLPNSNEPLIIINIKVKCDSGVYMRSLAKEIGLVLGVDSLAYSIRRTKIGDYPDIEMA